VCGRFTLTSSPERLAERFGLDEVPGLAPRFNIAPSQEVATVRRRDGSGARVLEMRRWGLVPSWARDPRVGNRMINARSETVAERPAFRSAFRLRRCLVPADGFYEWAGGRGPRQPYHIRLADGAPFGIAGLWERWSGPDGGVIESCTLLTTAANARLAAVHDRMPVILEPEAFERWLDPAVREPERLRDLLRPLPPERVALHPVSRRVNDPRNDDPGCVAPVDAPAPG
jgi:putative SOS response-associated peptidase YedK